jgi:hypothetical protein
MKMYVCIHVLWHTIGSQLLTGSFHPLTDEQWDHSCLEGPILAAYRRHTASTNNIGGDQKTPASSLSSSCIPTWWNDSQASIVTNEIDHTLSITRASLSEIAIRISFEGEDTRNHRHAIIAQRRLQDSQRAHQIAQATYNTHTVTMNDTLAEMTQTRNEIGRAVSYSATALQNALINGVAVAEIKRLLARHRWALLAQQTYPNEIGAHQWATTATTPSVAPSPFGWNHWNGAYYGGQMYVDSINDYIPHDIAMAAGVVPTLPMPAATAAGVVPTFPMPGPITGLPVAPLSYLPQQLPSTISSSAPSSSSSSDSGAAWGIGVLASPPPLAPFVHLPQHIPTLPVVPSAAVTAAAAAPTNLLSYHLGVPFNTQMSNTFDATSFLAPSTTTAMSMSSSPVIPNQSSLPALPLMTSYISPSATAAAQGQAMSNAAVAAAIAAAEAALAYQSSQMTYQSLAKALQSSDEPITGGPVRDTAMDRYTSITSQTTQASQLLEHELRCQRRCEMETAQAIIDDERAAVAEAKATERLRLSLTRSSSSLLQQTLILYHDMMNIIPSLISSTSISHRIIGHTMSSTTTNEHALWQHLGFPTPLDAMLYIARTLAEA